MLVDLIGWIQQFTLMWAKWISTVLKATSWKFVSVTLHSCTSLTTSCRFSVSTGHKPGRADNNAAGQGEVGGAFCGFAASSQPYPRGHVNTSRNYDLSHAKGLHGIQS
jgi:hypothetical protein